MIAGIESATSGSRAAADRAWAAAKSSCVSWYNGGSICAWSICSCWVLRGLVVRAQQERVDDRLGDKRLAGGVQQRLRHPVHHLARMLQVFRLRLADLSEQVPGAKRHRRRHGAATPSQLQRLVARRPRP